MRHLYQKNDKMTLKKSLSLELHPTETGPAKDPFMNSSFVRLWHHISGEQKKHLALLALLMVVGACAEIFSLGLVIPFLAVITQPKKIALQQPFAAFFNHLGLDPEPSTRIVLTLLFIFGVIVSGIVRITLLWAQTRIGNAIGSDLGSMAYEKTLNQPYLKHTQRNSSEIIATLQTKLNTMIYFVVIPSLTLVTSIFIGLAIILAATWLEPVTTISVSLFFAGIYFAIWTISKKRINKNSLLVKNQQNLVIQKIMEGLGAIRDILMDGTQAQYVRDYRLVDSRLRRSYGNLAIFAGLPRPMLESAGLVVLAGTAFLLLGQNLNAGNALQVVGVMALTAQKVLPLIQQAYSSWVSINGGIGCLKDVLELLEQPMPLYINKKSKGNGTFKNQFCLKNTYFRYSSSLPWILKGTSFTITKGSCVGLEGKTGTGKSTCVDLLMGLLKPAKGKILVDGKPLGCSNMQEWQNNISHVPQSIYLTDSTIAENIAFGVPVKDINIKKVREAAKKAEIANFIETTPQGYETKVGERGIRFSGGQKQRIGIARAIYKKKQLLILDEATSALDPATEKKILQNIRKENSTQTIVIISHRKKTLQQCDNIIKIK